jgi:hypothetical protein
MVGPIASAAPLSTSTLETARDSLMMAKLKDVYFCEDKD